jgi:hypothetical protein
MKNLMNSEENNFDNLTMLFKRLKFIENMNDTDDRDSIRNEGCINIETINHTL